MTIAQRTNPISTASDILSTLSPIFLGAGTSTTTKSKNSLSDALFEALATNINNPAYTKDAAKADSQGAVDVTTKRLMEQYLPDIATKERGAGVYNDTTTQLLGNDLATRAAGAGALVQQEAIKNYGAITNDANSSIGQILSNSRSTETSSTKVDPIIGSGGGSSLMMPLLGLGATLLAPTIGKYAMQGIDSLFGGGEAAAFNGTGMLQSFGNGASSSGFGDFISGLGKGCFITTAVCKYYGLKDNCYELTVLRNFRDTYMANTPKSQAKVASYYKYAPGLVTIFDEMAAPARESLYQSMYQHYILPAIVAIESGKFADAEDIYTSLFNFATSTAASVRDTASHAK
jgi:hypothetical protein